MCGIAGYFSKKSSPVGNTQTLMAMLEAQKHRGPDDQGICAFSFKSRNITECHSKQFAELAVDVEGVVGFNRLSIVDLSANGHQPMIDADGQVMLVFNGEIYNAPHYRSVLESEGIRFKGHSDTEVILKLYLKHGFDGMISKLNGMFAIVVVDTRNQTIFIARDRFGIKPMYIYENSDVVAFSSEVKSFLKLPGFSVKLNEEKIHEYLLFRNVINDTLYKDVVALEPGTYRTYKTDGTSNHRFYNVGRLKRNSNLISAKESADKLRRELTEAVERQLISDVKLGCQLSGGIDSSLVTAIAKEIKQDDFLETISITFANPTFNEEPFINQVTDKLNIQSHKFMMTPSYYTRQFEKATWHFEAPINHPNTIGIFLLSEEARKYVTVLLSGEGADEVFGGYDRFLLSMYPYNWRNLARELRRDFSFDYFSPEYRMVMGSSYMNPASAHRLFPSFKRKAALEKRMELASSLQGNSFDRQVKYEMQTFLPDLLMRQDKMSMAHSIENRVPFLDNEIVERSFEIPQHHLVSRTEKGIQSKWLLKEMASDWFGKDFAYRQKAGFGIPLREFFSEAEMSQMIWEELIPGIKARGMFDSKQIIDWMKNLQTTSAKELDALWIMLAFEKWASLYKI